MLQLTMSRSYVLNYLHCVFATKQRKPTINDTASVWAYIRGIARNCHFDLLAIGGTNNHVHLLLALPSGRNISDVMRDIKANSSRFIRANNRSFAWQDGYAAVSVSPSQIPAVKKYIANQEEHHRTRAFEDEYLALLKRSGVAFNADEVFG
jgi:REP element-mobilizing transposase RayT